jgi:NADH dehydrogenase [ubiquinone] 1 alpha subcomplex assembly factor 5
VSHHFDWRRSWGCATRRSFSPTSSDTSSSSSTSQAFDETFKTLQRNNAARAARKYPTQITAYDYLRDEIAVRLVDRLDDIRHNDGEGFPLALDVGAGAGHVYKAICADDALSGAGGGIGGVRKLVQFDAAAEALHRDVDTPPAGHERCETYRLVQANSSDSTANKLPFPDGTFDLVISSAALHWVNDLPGILTEVERVLKPDGCFLLAMIGGTTLPELRVAMVLAEQEREGGVSPHVGPFVDLSDLGGLLQRAGFALPTLDTDTVRVAVPHAGVVMEHLRRMGEGNATLKRRPVVGRDTFLAAACLYDHMFPVSSDSSNSSGEVEASIQVIYAIGWKPHASQQKPLERGSATHRITEMVQKHTKDDTTDNSTK